MNTLDDFDFSFELVDGQLVLTMAPDDGEDIRLVFEGLDEVANFASQVTIAAALTSHGVQGGTG